MLRLDKKAASFLTVGLLLGVLLTTSAFALVVLPRRGASDTESAPGRIVLKLAHAMDQAHPVHHALAHMAERLAAKSGGSVTLEIFPNGQLGSETDAISQVQRGALAMTKTSAATLEAFVRPMALFGLPYLFEDEAHYWRFLESAPGRELLTAGDGIGLRGLCYYDAGSRSFYTTKRPIVDPEDLRGSKIRVMPSQTAMDMVSRMGASPTPIPWGELYTALQQGMVDGAENNPPSFYSSRHFEVTKYYSLDEHTRIPDLVVISEPVWRGLGPDAQRWLQEAADESVVFQRELWAQKTREALEALAGAGVHVTRPDTARFVARVEPMYQTLSGETMRRWVQIVRSMKRVEQ